MGSGMIGYSTDLKNLNFAKIAEAMEIHGVRIDCNSKLRDELAAAFAHPSPAIIDVAVNHTDLVIPLLLLKPNK